MIGSEIDRSSVNQVHLVDEADGDAVLCPDQEVQLVHLHIVSDGHFEPVLIDEVPPVLVKKLLGPGQGLHAFDACHWYCYELGASNTYFQAKTS